MKLEIQNLEVAEVEALTEAITRAKNFAGNEGVYDHIIIVAQQRITAPAYEHQRNMIGWLEYPIYFFKAKGVQMIPNFEIHMIQRKPEAEFEFHS